MKFFLLYFSLTVLGTFFSGLYSYSVSVAQTSSLPLPVNSTDFIKLTQGMKEKKILDLLGKPHNQEKDQKTKESFWRYETSLQSALQVNLNSQGKLDSAITYFSKPRPSATLLIPADLLLEEEIPSTQGHLESSQRHVFHQGTGRTWVLSRHRPEVEAFMVTVLKKTKGKTRTLGDILRKPEVENGPADKGMSVKIPIGKKQIVEDLYEDPSTYERVQLQENSAPEKTPGPSLPPEDWPVD